MNELEFLSNTVMPFGKHKGKTFSEIAPGYFDWLVGQDWFKGPLRAKVERYLELPVIKRAVEKEMNR